MTYEPRKFACTHCGQHVEAEVSFAGQTVACPCCQQPMRIPQRQHFLVSRPRGGAGIKRAIWVVVILALLAGGWYFATQQGLAPRFGPRASTTTIDGRAYLLRHLAPDELARLIQRALDPPAMRHAKLVSLSNVTFRGDSMVTTLIYEAARNRTEAEVRAIMGDPSRLVRDGKDAADPAVGSFYQLHYYYRTSAKGEMAVVVAVNGGTATQAEVTGGSDMLPFVSTVALMGASSPKAD